mmetsp:Transcript_11900/g.25567  ORF Transcript_11900/g.25567 Transcript_11900/m.25567 type:complete len:206 (+) Transcript_11900:314-931(+)
MADATARRWVRAPSGTCGPSAPPLVPGSTSRTPRAPPLLPAATTQLPLLPEPLPSLSSEVVVRRAAWRTSTSLTRGPTPGPPCLPMTPSAAAAAAASPPPLTAAASTCLPDSVATSWLTASATTWQQESGRKLPPCQWPAVSSEPPCTAPLRLQAAAVQAAGMAATSWRSVERWTPRLRVMRERVTLARTCSATMSLPATGTSCL